MPPQPLLTLDCHQLVTVNEKFVEVISVKDLVVFYANLGLR